MANSRMHDFSSGDGREVIFRVISSKGGGLKRKKVWRKNAGG